VGILVYIGKKMDNLVQKKKTLWSILVSKQVDSLVYIGVYIGKKVDTLVCIGVKKWTL